MKNMMNILKNTAKALTLAAALLIGATSAAHAATIAVIDITDKTGAERLGAQNYYENSVEFASTVASMLSDKIGEAPGIEADGYDATRKAAADYLGKGRFYKSAKFTRSEAIDFGRENGIDYIVTGNITDANVKESNIFDGDTARKKFSMWSAMELTIIDTETGDTLFSRTYEGKNQIIRDVLPGRSSKLNPMERNPQMFAESEVGAPFASIADQFTADIEAEIGL